MMRLCGCVGRQQLQQVTNKVRQQLNKLPGGKTDVGKGIQNGISTARKALNKLPGGQTDVGKGVQNGVSAARKALNAAAAKVNPKLATKIPKDAAKPTANKLAALSKKIAGAEVSPGLMRGVVCRLEPAETVFCTRGSTSAVW